MIAAIYGRKSTDHGRGGRANCLEFPNGIHNTVRTGYHDAA